MRRLGLWTAWALVLGSAASARAQGKLDPVKLEWKWEKGKTFYVETVTSLRQNMILKDPGGDERKDREIKQNLDHLTLYSYTVKDRKDDGSVVLVQRVERMAVLKPKVAENEAMKDAEVTLHLDARGDVVKLEGFEAFRKKLIGEEPDPRQRKTIEAILTEEEFKRTALDGLRFRPFAAVKPGATWRRSADLTLGPLGHIKTARRYTFDGPDKDKPELARLSFTIALLEYQAPKPQPLLYQVRDARFEGIVLLPDLFPGEGNGTVVFNTAAGRLVQTECTFRLKGSLTLKDDSSTHRTTIDQEQTIKTRVLDELPKPEVKKAQ